MSDPFIWPITIVATRYGGVYEGGKFAAFNQYPYEIHIDAMGDDGDASYFWNSYDAEKVGRGNTPGSAMVDLQKRLEE